MPGNFDERLHPRGPVGRFIETSGPGPRRRDAEDVQRDVQQVYLDGSLVDGPRPSSFGRTDQSVVGNYALDPWINGSLRSGSGVDEDLPRDVQDRDDYVRRLDGVVDSYALREDTTVYRGVAGVGEDGVLSSARPGDQIVDRGYTSTSLDQSIPNQFGEDVLEITLPAGTRAAPISQPAFGGYPPQAELLVGRGAVLEISSIDDTGEVGRFGGPVRRIRAELVGYVED